MIEQFRTRLKEIFQIREEEKTSEEEVDDTEVDDSGDDEDIDIPDEAMDDISDAINQDVETSDENDEEKTPEEETDDSPESKEEPTEPVEKPKSDQEKVNEMFTDTGDPTKDWSITNENNVRLFNFYFKNAGLDVGSLMTETEKPIGVSYDELISRLTPDLYENFKKKSDDIRNKFIKIDEREKNIIIYNSRIPFYVEDEQGYRKLQDTEPLFKEAIGKLNKYLMKKYGKYWQDEKESINFIKEVKVDFSEDISIMPNLMTFEHLEEFGGFNNISVEQPKSVKEFVRENLNNNLYAPSTFFKSLYGVNEEGGQPTGLYPLIKVITSEQTEEPSEEEAEGVTDDGISDDIGGGGGGGGFGDMGVDLGDGVPSEEGLEGEEGEEGTEGAEGIEGEAGTDEVETEETPEEVV